ncbi:MAG: DUF2029 domain-containing protein [Bacteroidetes bacterium]|nr:DUF2029 domain-containing protein [Bacteroidota bacterium]
MTEIFSNRKYHSILFLILLALFFVFVFFPSLKKINTDFPNYYVSANMLLDGADLKSAYDNVEFNKQVLLYGIENQIVSFVPYPPVNSLLMLPVARLEPLTAKLIWNILNLIFFLLSAFFISKISGLNLFLTGILFFLSGYAFVNNFFFGQAYLLVLLLFSASLYFLFRENDVLAAFMFSLSVLLKFYTIFFIILFLCRKKYKLVITTVIFIIILNLFVFTITGWDINIYYYTAIMPRISDGWVGTVYAPEFQSVISLLHTLFYRELSLNPYPLTESPELYFIFKYLFYFGIILTSVLSVMNSGAGKDVNSFKMQIPLFSFVCMLLLPVNASYQYVILITAIAILSHHYISEKKYILTAVILSLFFIMNSPLTVYIINMTKNKHYFYLGYIKLYILLIFWVTGLSVSGRSSVENITKATLLRYSYVYVFLILIFVKVSLTQISDDNDGAENILINSNYLISMPAVRDGKILFTECRNEKFILNSNFGFKTESDNYFNPDFINDNEIEYTTFVKGKTVYNRLSLNSLDRTEIAKRTDSVGAMYSGDKTMRCYSLNGQIFLERINEIKTEQMTTGRSFNYFPVFNGDDSGIIFCSDRGRGVGFTALYEIKINK